MTEGNSCKITFSVMGHVVQTVDLKPGVDRDLLDKQLNSGDVLTTIQEGGPVIVTATGEVLGTIAAVDNNCEYEDFVVEES